MNCPKCEKEMVAGIISIEAAGKCSIVWAESESKEYKMERVSTATMKELFQVPSKLKFPKGLTHTAFRCTQCELITFDYSKHMSV